jgi:tetratricopeptide (TPR) repeat protein
MRALLAGGALAAAAPASSKPGPAPTAEEAIAALTAVDAHRLYADKAYAATMLSALEAAASTLSTDPRALASVEFLRGAALSTLERPDEAVAAVRRAVAIRPGDGSVQASAVFVAARADRPLDALALIEGAAASVRDPKELDQLRQGLDEELVNWLGDQLRTTKMGPEQDRLWQALLAIQWPSPDRPGVVDGLRQAVIKSLLPGGESRAKALLAQISDPAALVPLIVSRRYDNLFAGDSDRLARLDAAIAAFDKGSAERLRRKPDDPGTIFERVQYLRAVGREEEALVLLLPWVRDMQRVEAGGEKAFWLVNEAAYALTTVGRADEGVATMEQIIGLDLDSYPYLINMAINHTEILIAAKRYADAARYAEALFATGKGGASTYGRMWMWSNAACAHVRAGQPAEAAPWLERLKASSDENPAAHMQALLCAGDLDLAEAVMLKRLDSDDSEELIVDLQDYALDAGGIDPLLAKAMAELRNRPAVAAAIARRGHVFKLPLSRTYWTDY